MKPKHKTEDHDFSQLEAFQSIDTEGDWNQVRQRMGFEEARISENPISENPVSENPVSENPGSKNRGSINPSLKKRNLRKRHLAIAWKAAASIIVILGVGYLSQRYVFSPKEMISARAGDALMLVTLQDGSRVSLNSNSELFYPEKFRGGKREVLLKGEAFFEVEKNPNKPFLVNIEKKAMVEVLGTSFNIRSDQFGEAISVLVVEGRVALRDADGDAESKIPGLILEKDEQATMKQGILKRDETPNKNMLSWKTGILYFDQSYISDVVHQLESHYKMKILLDENVPLDLQFTSTIDNQELGSILEEMSMVLGLEISYDYDNEISYDTDKDIYIDNKNDKILISKPL